MGDTRQATALFIDGGTDLEASLKFESAPADCLRRVDGGCQSGLHVRASPSVERSIPHEPGEGVDGPTVAWWNDINVTVQVEAGPGAASPATADDVDSGVFVGVFVKSFSRMKLDLEAEVSQASSDMLGTSAVVAPRRIDSWDAQELAGELD
jgi:hypothetical protein